MPRTCSAHFFASSLSFRSLTAASAVFIAAEACVKMLPHHPPCCSPCSPPCPSPSPCCWAPAAGGALFSSPCSSELVALGVKLALSDLALSTDFLAAAGPAAAPPLSSDLRVRGVCGREGGFWVLSSDSSSARMSASAAGLPGVFLAEGAFLTSGMPSKRESRSSSGAALVRLAAIVAAVGGWWWVRGLSSVWEMVSGELWDLWSYWYYWDSWMWSGGLRGA